MFFFVKTNKVMQIEELVKFKKVKHLKTKKKIIVFLIK